MKKLKLLIPALGTVAALSAVVPAVSCGTPKDENKKTYTISLDESCKDYFTLSVTKIQEGHDLYLNIVPKEGYGINANAETFLKITIGTTELDAEKFEIDEERANAELLPIVIKAEDINGNISIAVKQQILSHANFVNPTARIPNDSIAVSWGSSGMPYLEESEADQEQAVTFYINDSRYPEGDYALYVNIDENTPTLTDVDGTPHELHFKEYGSTLGAFDYTIDLTDGFYTSYKTLIFGAGTFSKTTPSELLAEIIVENVGEQTIYADDECSHHEDFDVSSQTKKTTNLYTEGIQLYIKAESRDNHWFCPLDGENYKVDLYYDNVRQTTVIPDRVELSDDDRGATLYFNYEKVWLITYEFSYCNLYVVPNIMAEL